MLCAFLAHVTRHPWGGVVVPPHAAHPKNPFFGTFSGSWSGALRRQSSAAATSERTQQENKFCWVRAFRPPGSNKTKFFVGFGWCGLRRPGAALRVGLPPLGPGAVVRPRPSFGGAAPPRAALRCALPLGPLGGGCRSAPFPPAPLPLRGRGV